MQFEHPHLLWFALLAVPALIAFFWWAGRVKRELIGQFIAARLLSSLTVGLSSSRQRWRAGLFIAAVVLTILSLARLQIGFSWEEARSRGLDIVVAIDTSRSMLATDVAPNRLRRAQLAALDLKRLARADRLGLVAFAGSAFLQCPLTLDDEAFRQSVESLDVDIIPQGGTALAEAIAAAKGAFKKDNDNHKVLVLFTDGEDHDGNAAEAAKTAGKDGLRIFTVGVGTASGELLRTMDVSGRSEFIKDEDGNAVKSRLNDSLLKEMAQETGGFYMLLSGANTMNVLYERGLAPLPKGDLASQRIKRQHERYQWLLGLAIVLLLLEMLLPERVTSKPVKAAETESPVVKTAAMMLLVGLLMTGTTASAGTGRALKDYQKGDFEKAQQEYERALKSTPEDPRLSFNAGAAAFQNKDYDQALAHLSSALVTQDVPLQQRTYYNLGNTHYRRGEEAKDPKEKQQAWEQAVKSYDSALKLDAKDADAEFNRELVKKRLEELKQQQQQNQDNKDDKDNKDKKDDQKDQNDQSKQDQQKQQQSKDQQSKDQQKKDDAQKQQQQQQQDQKSKDEEKKQQNQGSKPDEKDGEKKEGEQAQQADKGEEPQDGEGSPQSAKAVRMTPQQAMQLLETLKGEEKAMPFRPMAKTNRQDRIFKNW